MQKMEFILTLILLLIGWLACLLGSIYHHQWIGPTYVLTFCVAYLALAKIPFETIKFMLCMVVIGYSIDSLLKLFGIIHFLPSSYYVGQLPLWYTSLWLLFACAFPTLFKSFINRYYIASLVGLIVGPLFYSIAMLMGALQFHENIYISLISIGISWGLMLPVFVKILKMTSLHPQTTIKANH